MLATSRACRCLMVRPLACASLRRDEHSGRQRCYRAPTDAHTGVGRAADVVLHAFGSASPYSGASQLQTQRVCGKDASILLGAPVRLARCNQERSCSRSQRVCYVRLFIVRTLTAGHRRCLVAARAAKRRCRDCTRTRHKASQVRLPARPGARAAETRAPALYQGL